MTDLVTLRTQAEALAAALPPLTFRSNASAAPHVGSAGRRKAGTGEHFWQYRRYTSEDSADRIDWRRSARGDEVFVRETELETARTVLFWCDPHRGFDWRGGDDRSTKAEAARLIMMALGALLSREGERIGVLGNARAPGFGKRAIERLGEELAAQASGDALAPPRRSATLVLASDFYDPVDTWRTRLAPLAGRCREGVLFAISDPLEVSFPFRGRLRFSRPGEAANRLFGRAETVRTAYETRFTEHRQALKDLTRQFGWRFVTHETDTPALSGAAALKQAIESFGPAGGR